MIVVTDTSPLNYLVLVAAGERRLLELRPVLEALQRTTCRIPEGFVQAALDRATARGA